MIVQQDADIHWLSIINSFVLVILLTAFLSVILLRVLKKDLAAYMEVKLSSFMCSLYFRSHIVLLFSSLFKMVFIDP